MLTQKQIELYIEKAKLYNLSVTVKEKSDEPLREAKGAAIMHMGDATWDDVEGLVKELCKGGIEMSVIYPIRTVRGEAIARQSLKDNPKEDAAARRYLIVNGWISLTAENVAGIPNFHVGADMLPPDLVKDLSEWAEKHKDDEDEPLTYSEDEEETTTDVEPFKLDGVWISNGEIVDFAVERRERRIATAVYSGELPRAEARKIP